MPRWGKIGKQKIEDAGTLYPKRMETVDDEIRDLSFKFMDKAKADGKPFFVWLNPTRMHIVTHLSPKYLTTYFVWRSGVPTCDRSRTKKWPSHRSANST